MRPLNRGLLWTASGVFALACWATAYGQDAQRPSSQPASVETQQSSTNSGAKSAELPDSAGATLAKLQEAAPQQSDATQAPAPQSSNQQNAAQPEKLQRPLGTAAAPAPPVSGVTAAQPAGVAIAPAKQHRVRTIILRTGAIVGAAAAIGTVVALTEATPSKPPGAH